ncbi:MAG: hypothetical protein V6Z82_03210 [Flavobacteriales bacterium]
MSNFISDFIADPENAGKGRKQALDLYRLSKSPAEVIIMGDAA